MAVIVVQGVHDFIINQVNLKDPCLFNDCIYKRSTQPKPNTNKYAKKKDY